MKQKAYTNFEKYLLFALFFELFAGGGGHFFDVGPLSIRQVLFVLFLGTFAVRFFINKKSRKEILGQLFAYQSSVWWLTVAMLLWVGVAAVIGVVNHHPIGIIGTDAFRVIYLITLFPFMYYIKEDRFTKKDFLKVLFIATLVISIVTITIAIVGKFMNNHQFYYFYQWINKIFPEDLYFRPSRGVFHKSHFLIMFAVIITSVKFMEKESNLLQNILLVVGGTSIILSETRGLFLGYFIGLFTYLAVKTVVFFFGNKESLHLSKKRNIRRGVFLLVACSLTGYFYQNSTIARFSNDNTVVKEEMKGGKEKVEIEDVSMNIRYVLLADSVKLVKNSTSGMILGNGYGTKIGDRITGIEMSFVDIFVEQGLIGLILWLTFSLMPLYYYFRTFLIKKELANSHIGLLGSSLAAILVTNINPFLNSPIGLGFLLPVIVMSYKLFQEAKQEQQLNK